MTLSIKVPLQNLEENLVRKGRPQNQNLNQNLRYQQVLLLQNLVLKSGSLLMKS